MLNVTPMRKEFSVIFALLVLIWTSISQVTDCWERMQVWKEGRVESALIIKMSPQYSRKSAIYVQAGGRTFSIRVRNEDYTVAAFKVGDSIPIRIHPAYDVSLREDENPTSRIYVAGLFVFLTGLVGWYLLRKMGKPSTKPFKPKKKRKSLRRRQKNLAMKKQAG